MWKYKDLPDDENGLRHPPSTSPGISDYRQADRTSEEEQNKTWRRGKFSLNLPPSSSRWRITAPYKSLVYLSTTLDKKSNEVCASRRRTQKADCRRWEFQNVFGNELVLGGGGKRGRSGETTSNFATIQESRPRKRSNAPTVKIS